MASRSLGTLTIDLVAKTAGFVQGMDKAQRESREWKRSVQKDLNAISKTFKVVGAAAAAGLALMVKNSVSSARELEKLTQLSNTSSQSFQRLSISAGKYGIQQEKVADILKDTNDKIGDFIQTGGGPLKDFFDNIAPQVGVTAEEFRNLSGDQALGLYVSSLEKANLSQEDMIFFMEAIASDATLLLPLLSDNGKELKELGDQAERFGAVVSDADLQSLNQVGDAVRDLSLAYKGMQNEIVLGALPAITELTDLLSDPQTIENAKTLGSALITVFSAVVSIVGEVARRTKSLGEGIAQLVGATGLDTQVKKYNDNLKEIAELQEKIDSGESGFLDQTRLNSIIKQNAELEEQTRAYRQLAEDRKTITAIQEQEQAKEAVLNEKRKESLALTESQRKAQEKAAAEAKKLQDAYANVESSLGQQIALFDKTSEASRVRYEIENSNLAAIDEAQKNKLIMMAEEIDKLSEIAESENEYKSLVRELRTEEEALADVARERLEILEAMSGIDPEQREQTQSRILDGLSIESPELTTDLEESSLALEEWRESQLETLENFYSDRNDLAEEYNQRQLETEKEYEDRKLQIAKQAEEERRQSLIEGYTILLDVAGEYYSGLEGKEAAAARVALAVGKALLNEKSRNALKEIAMSTQAAAMGAYQALAPIPFVGPALGATAAAGIVVAGAAAASKVIGIAHDGIDSVPQTGTWLLEQGERVVTSETSKKLDKKLDNMGGAGVTVNISNNVSNANVSAESDESGRVISIVVNDIERGGSFNDALTRRFGLKRQGS